MTNSKAATTHFLERDGGRIAYQVSGDGPLVVAIPGMGDLRTSYGALTLALTGAGFRVAAMDLRGHGDSDATFQTYDDEAAASDALALVAQLGGPAVLVGNSMAAGAAVIAAARRPELVNGLILLGPFVRNPSTSWFATAMFRALMGGPWAGRAWLAYYPKLYPGRRDAAFDVHRDEIAASLKKPGHVTAFRKTTHTSHAPAESAAPQVGVPTLVVMGEKDPDFADPTAEAQWVGRTLKGSVVLVPNSGHYPHAEFPEVTSPAVVAFLQRELRHDA
jgi:pimeloyl-ACP methyl ester carboxylesterase